MLFVVSPAIVIALGVARGAAPLAPMAARLSMQLRRFELGCAVPAHAMPRPPRGSLSVPAVRCQDRGAARTAASPVSSSALLSSASASASAASSPSSLNRVVIIFIIVAVVIPPSISGGSLGPPEPPWRPHACQAIPYICHHAKPCRAMFDFSGTSGLGVRSATATATGISLFVARPLQQGCRRHRSLLACIVLRLRGQPTARGRSNPCPSLATSGDR